MTIRKEAAPKGKQGGGDQKDEPEEYTNAIMTQMPQYNVHIII